MAKNNKSTDVLDLVENPVENLENGAPGTPARTPEQIEEEIKRAQELIKNLKAEKKGEKPKKEKVVKGRMVAFKNKAGEQIVGMGVLYYVARSGGKLHYKEASNVTLLPENWKEGDPIPEGAGDTQVTE